MYSLPYQGVGGCVISDDNKILVVKERKNADIVGWKLPGGLVNLGEEFSDAVKREIYEETGVATIFESILSFRHSHNIQFGRSDVYIICKLKPTTKTSDLAKVKVDNEIADAKWYFAVIATHSYPRNIYSLIHLIVGSTSTNTSRLISIR